MSEHYKLAIIGAGPGGLSAAITAANCGLSHVLLERADHLSDTLFKYQKGKKVMAHPMRLPLLGTLPFGEGIREGILDAWSATATQARINVRLNAPVNGIKGQRGTFQIILPGDEVIAADEIILAIGLQGNLRKLPVPGADREWVQYQLDDPDAYRNERITVIGAGDAGIENALALATHNDVSIVNRDAEFLRSKPGNAAAIERAVRTGLIRGYCSSNPARVEDDGLVLDTPEGQVLVPADRIIARLGAIPPRKFLEDCGIVFPSKDPAAVPELSATNESNVPGLYLIGALAGYTLIKQAINQGHEVVRRLAGDPIEPADESLLRQRFTGAFPTRSVNDVLTYIREKVPVLAGLTMLQLREVMLESNIQRFQPEEVVFRRGDYTNSLWSIAEGSVRVRIDESRPDKDVMLGEREFFGELGLLSGRRRSATVIAGGPSVLVEIPRRSMRRLQSSVEAIKAELDRVAVRRMIHDAIGHDLPAEELELVAQAAELRAYKAHELICAEGDPVDAIYILRNGSATISRMIGNREAQLGYIAARGLFGERGLLDENATRSAHIRATVPTEAIRIDANTIRALMRRQPGLRALFERALRRQMDNDVHLALANASQPHERPNDAVVTAFLVNQGVGEATNAFIIDESLCVRCDNCEKACAATHNGISRVKREAGPGAVSIRLPVACRHCENPHCMSDCPVDAITRAPTGEVFINQATCIGCSNCANNCPYGVISMVDPKSGEPAPENFIARFLAGIGIKGPQRAEVSHDGAHEKKAVKCDLCKDGDGPACVSACPTGAAIRIEPEAYMAWLRNKAV